MSKRENKIIPPEGSILYVDIGNSFLKAGYQVGGRWQNPDIGVPETRTASDFVAWVNNYASRFALVVITSVVPEITEGLVEGLKGVPNRVLTVDDIPRELIDYETPASLGLDRFWGCYGAVAHTQKSAVVVDAGSACTLDYMAPDFVYRGGIIMPGLNIIEDAMQNRIPGLPKVERKIPDVWPGKSTRTSLQWGITGSYIHAIEGILHRYEEMFGTFDLVATGGGAHELSELIETREMKVRPSLVFDGMKEFLNDYL